MSFKRNFFATATSQGVITLLSLVASAIVARSLEPENQGTLRLALLIPLAVSGFGVFGFEMAHLVFSGKYPERRGQMLAQSLVVPLASGVMIFAFGGALVWLRPAWAEEYLSVGEPLFLCALFLLPVNFFYALFTQCLFGANRILPVSVMNVGRAMVYLLAAALAVTLLPPEHRVAGVVASTILAPLLFLPVIAGQSLRLAPLREWRLNRAWLGRSLGVGYKAYLANVGSQLVYRLNEFMIVALLATEPDFRKYVGWFAVAVALADKIQLAPKQMAAVLTPHLSATTERPEVVTAKTFRFNVLVMAAIIGTVAALVVPMVLLIYGDKYSNSIAPLLWMLPGIFFLGCTRPIPAYMAFKEKLHYAMGIAWLGAALTVPLNYLLIPRLKIQGAGIASTISYTIVSFIWIVCFIRESGVRLRHLIPTASDVRQCIEILRAARRKAASRLRRGNGPDRPADPPGSSNDC